MQSFKLIILTIFLTAISYTSCQAMEESSLWRELNLKINEIKTANAPINRPKTLIFMIPEVTLADAIVRMETFLAEQDLVSVEGMSAEMVEYHKLSTEFIGKMIDVLNKGIEASEAQSNNAKGRAFALNLEIFKIIRTADEAKPRIKFLHQAINKKMPSEQQFAFWETLNLQDKVVEAKEKTPEQLDAEFLTFAKSLNDGYGYIAQKLIDNRTSLNPTKDALREIANGYVDFYMKFWEDTIKDSTASLSAAINNSKINPTTKAIIQIVVDHRNNNTKGYIKRDDFYFSIERWLNDDTELPRAKASTTVAVSVDGKICAYSPDGQNIIIRTIADGKVVREIKGQDQSLVMELGFANNGNLFVTATDKLEEINITSGKPVYTRSITSPQYTGVLSVSPDGSTFAWSMGTFPIIATMSSNDEYTLVGSDVSRISAISFAPNGSRLAVGRAGDEIRITDKMDPSSRVTIMDFNANEAGSNVNTKIDSSSKYTHQSTRITDVEFSSDSKRILSISNGLYGGMAVVEDVEINDTPRLYLAIDDQPYQNAFFAGQDDSHIVAISANGIVRVWDSKNGSLLNLFNITPGPSGIASGITDDKLIVASVGRNLCQVINWKTGALLSTWAGESTKENLVNNELLKKEQGYRKALDAYSQLMVKYNGLPKKDEISDEQKAGFVSYLEGVQKEHGQTFRDMGRAKYVTRFITYYKINDIYQDLKAGKFDKVNAECQRMIANDVHDERVYDYGSEALLFQKKYNAARTLIRTAIDRFGESSKRLQKQYHYIESFIEATNGSGDKALEHANKMEELGSSAKRVKSRRHYAYLRVAAQKNQQGKLQDSLGALDKASQHARDDATRLYCFEMGFNYAYSAKQYQIAVNLANLILKMDPKKKNNKSFMDCARYAYSQIKK